MSLLDQPPLFPEFEFRASCPVRVRRLTFFGFKFTVVRFKSGILIYVSRFSGNPVQFSRERLFTIGK